jgi:acyl-CoA thioesterase-1
MLCALVSPGITVAEPLRIVALGDSLMAGYGLAEKDGFPAKLQAALRAKGHDVEVINAGVSGDTASGGLARLDWSVPDNTNAVILELGANDALRAVDPAATRKALDEMLKRLKARKIEVLLAGMQAPRNMGTDYIAVFDRIYPELAKTHGVLLYPFFLDGVAADARLNQRDGIHPTAAGVDVIVERILPSVEKLIAQARANQKD